MKTIKELQEEIKLLTQKLKGLESELNHRKGFKLMRITKGGKPTFVLHPERQVSNLTSNGWKVCSVEEMLDFLKNYDL